MDIAKGRARSITKRPAGLGSRSLPVGWGPKSILVLSLWQSLWLTRYNQLQVLSNPPQDWYVSRNLDKGTQVLLVLAIYQYHSNVLPKAEELKDQ